jgi:hypothetical protein
MAAMSVTEHEVKMKLHNGLENGESEANLKAKG